MTLAEAIKIGKLYAKGVPEHNHTDFEDALLLLIEAGKREMEYRPKTEPRDFDLLPGETK